MQKLPGDLSDLTPRSGQIRSTPPGSSSTLLHRRFLAGALAFISLGLGTTTSVWAQTFPVTATVAFETGLRKLATITLVRDDGAEVDWGDGSPRQPGLLVDCRDFLNRTCDVYGTHRYTTLGTFLITIRYTSPGLFPSPEAVTTTATTVPIGDFVILSIGDSVASGEGNPRVTRDRVFEDPRPINLGLWDDPESSYGLSGECHRTALAGPATAGSFLRATNPGSGITFLHVACSGAKINAGPVVSIINQLRNARRSLETARLEAGGLPDGEPINIDVLMISGGANNIAGGFGTIVSSCINPLTDCSEDEDLRALMSASFADLPDAYQALANEINTPTENTKGTISDVYISEYFDPTRDENGDFPTIGSCPAGALQNSEWVFLYHNMVVPLNQAVAAAATAHGWHAVDGIASDFRTHGYCAPSDDSWVVKLPESVAAQGDQLGTAHPNFTGQLNYRGHIATTVILFTPPVTTASGLAGGQPYVFGDWTAEDVEVMLSAVNPISQSGLERTFFAVDDPACTPQAAADCSLYSGPFVISDSGTHTVSFFSENQYGALEPLKTVLVRIDKDPPRMTCEPTPSVLWSPNGKLIPVSLAVTAVDDVSGPAPFVLSSVETSEGDPATDIHGFLTGQADTEGWLRATRFGFGPGREYALTYESADHLGNVGRCTAIVTVPHDQRRGSR